jgi:hypothetical protein
MAGRLPLGVKVPLRCPRCRKFGLLQQVSFWRFSHYHARGKRKYCYLAGKNLKRIRRLRKDAKL